MHPVSSLPTPPSLSTGPLRLLPLRFTVALIFISSIVGFVHDVHTHQLRSNHHTLHYESNGRIFPSVSLAAEIGVGIDLGTTNSAIAFLDSDNVPQIIEIPNNGRTVKSVVAFDENSEPLVGKEALDWEHEYKETAYRHVKRVIGTSFNNLSDGTREVVPHLVPDRCGEEDESFQKGKKKGKWKKKKKKKGPSLIRILEDADNYPTKLFFGKSESGNSCISPEDVSSCVLQRLLQVASDYTGDSITRAVIGIPAYFNDAQKEATERAARASGIEKVQLLREPEAAALAYGIDMNFDSEEELVLVFDLGGGTYDVSVLTVGRGLTEIMCTSGNSQLGGTNFDARIAKHLSKLTNGCCRSEDSMGMVLKAAESIRIALSNNRVVKFALPSTEERWLQMNEGREVIVMSSEAEKFEGADFEAGDSNNSTHSFHQLSRKEMEKLCVNEFQDLIRPIREVAIMSGAMLSGDASPSVVDTAIEKEKEMAEFEKFYYDDDQVGDAMVEVEEQQPETTNDLKIDIRSAKKAQQKGRKKARQMAKQERKYREETRKINQPDNNAKIRVEGISGRPISRVVLVGGATRMPTIGRIISSLTGVTPQRTVDPDEAVALGCAVQVGVLDGKEEMGVVLNPMKAALLRAAIEKERREGRMVDEVEEDDEEFTNIEYF